ncbi:hypothetical protein CGZ91_09315 [Parenemella sanctibonifatiensis]|uniref:Type II secretion system protein GspF domain-containing protein n=2 Tax=Parenemella sanctibonifatiensis TaxID=2016505 RepID=A0A255EFN2_9ACTN|nr:hypothetical protein CGZ91_09315 [Parenemella sanctibonifatiensis]
MVRTGRIMTAVAVACGVALVGGALLIVAGLRRSTELSTAVWKPIKVPARWWRTGIVALLGGIAAAALTGLPIMLVLVPVTVALMPYLLSAPPNDEITRLEALDRWVAQLIGVLGTGTSLVDAIRSSARTAPVILREPIATMIIRIDDGSPPQRALRGFADDFSEPDVDSVAAALMVASANGGTGARACLRALAAALQHRLSALRDIEAERAKPRVVVRQVTMITLVVLAAALVVGRSFFEPYATPVGQVILTVLVGIYLAALLGMRRLTVPRRRARILLGGQS